MRLILWILLSVSLPAISYAQVHGVVNNDTWHIQPGTIRVVGLLKRIDSQSATLKIIQVKAQGQGVVNILSDGDEVIVKLRGETKEVINGKVEAYLRENLEIDASQSTYTLMGLKKMKK